MGGNPKTVLLFLARHYDAFTLHYHLDLWQFNRNRNSCFLSLTENTIPSSTNTRILFGQTEHGINKLQTCSSYIPSAIIKGYIQWKWIKYADLWFRISTINKKKIVTKKTWKVKNERKENTCILIQDNSLAIMVLSHTSNSYEVMSTQKTC